MQSDEEEGEKSDLNFTGLGFEKENNNNENMPNNHNSKDKKEYTSYNKDNNNNIYKNKNSKDNKEYTDDGISLNEKGYEKVWNLIRKVVDKNGGKKD